MALLKYDGNSIEWLILYDDQSTFSSEDGIHWDAPREGVQAVWQRDDEVGYENVGHPSPSSPGYWVYDNGWIGVDAGGKHDHMRNCRHPLVIEGRYLTRPHWREIQRLIKEHTGVLKKLWYPGERAA